MVRWRLVTSDYSDCDAALLLALTLVLSENLLDGILVPLFPVDNRISTYAIESFIYNFIQ